MTWAQLIAMIVVSFVGLPALLCAIGRDIGDGPGRGDGGDW